MKKITIVDYGSGNVLSAQKSFIKIAKDNNIEVEVLISKKLNDVKNSTHIVLPGQGAFSTCMNGLKKTDGLIDELSEFAIIKKKPFLGICVGMQMLAKLSEENGFHEGLGWIDGKIKVLPGDNLKLPHMGWNLVNPTNLKYNKLISAKNDYYFVHSYYFDCANKDNILAETKYGINFASIVGKENIYGVQFHPEKSSSQGLNLLKEFIRI
ncbi:imidazole glycerol phosphate synthase subunit HisH [Pelagibacteraceae bacterium]|nr:imidazole glycerol phosphate synthase subunit HisH [Pelagibacteraceae bacterium]